MASLVWCEPTSVGRDAIGNSVRIRPISDGDAERWDAFVLKHKFGSPFHLMAWKRSIEQTFRYRPVYLIAEQHGRVRGVLPLFLVKSLLAGKVLLSVPFAVYGGVLADSDETLAAFRTEIERLGHEMKVDYVELRNAYPDQRLGFQRISRYVTFTSDICPDEAAMLENIPRKTRRMVRRSLEHGLESYEVQDLNGFEALYHASLRRLGTPSFPSAHFTNLARHFGTSVSVREVRSGDKVVASVFSFYFRDQVLPYYGASDGDFHHLAPNNFMYFDLMRSAGASGYRVFDFGRSKKNVSGSYDFKSHWGMVERELPYEMLLVRRKEPPHISPANPKFDVPRKIWGRVPLPVTKAVGPYLLRMVP